MKFRKETWHVDKGVEKETCRLSQRHVYFHSTNDDGFSLSLSPPLTHTHFIFLFLSICLSLRLSLYFSEIVFFSLSLSCFAFIFETPFLSFPIILLLCPLSVTWCLDHQRQAMGSLSFTIALSLSLFVSSQLSDVDRLSRSLSFSSCLHNHDGIDGAWYLCLCV